MSKFMLIIIILISLVFFSGTLYWLLLPYLGVGWAYVVEQMLPVAIAFIAVFVVLKKKNFNFNSIKKILHEHKNYFVLLLVFSVLAHGWIMGYYFFAEDVSSILSPINNNVSQFLFNPIINGYPFSPFVLSFLLFGVNVLAYNLFSFFLFFLGVILFYWFVYVVISDKFPAFIAALFFTTTPAFLDMFSWQGSVQGMSAVLVLSLVSLIFLAYYQKSSDYNFHLLSLFFFISSLNMGFVRTGGIVIVIFFMLFFLRPKFKFTAKDSMVSGFSYLIAWVGFIWIRFGLGLLFAPFSFLFKTTDSIAHVSYLPFISYYMSHLIMPTALARLILPAVKESFSGLASISIIFILGLSTLFALAALALIAVKKRKKITWWTILLGVVFILANIFYLPFFTLGATTKIMLFDLHFVFDVPPYGPGARYVFFPALGMSILFMVLIIGLIKNNRFVRKIGIFLMISIIGMNVYLSIIGHQKIIKYISTPEKSLIGNFLKLVPRDGKLKLVFSANPQKNAIDNNVGGRNWLYGFYKYNEISYINDEDEFYRLINSGVYKKENIYAFYNNPETNAFKDLSREIRQQTFKSKGSSSDFRINFLSKASSIARISTDGKNYNALNRALLESEDINYRLLFKKTLAIDLSVERLQTDRLPYSDFVVLNTEYPNILWSIVPENYPAVFNQEYNIPSEFNLESFNYLSLKDFSLLNKMEIVSILDERDRLRRGIFVSVSNKDTDEKRVDENALMDGLYASDPSPSKEEKFYLAKSSPAVIDITLPYPIILGRVLLNTPKSYATEYIPTDFDVLSSNDGVFFEEVRDPIENQEKLDWSPNNGRMIYANLKPVRSRYLKLVFKKTSGNPVMFDEIIVDDRNALKYSPQQIADYHRNAFLYVDNLDLLNSLTSLRYYSRIPLIYACAEDVDWQRQNKNFGILLPGVWKVKEIDLTEKKIILPINCNGSSLRKIIIFGPPYATKILVNSATLQ